MIWHLGRNANIKRKVSTSFLFKFFRARCCKTSRVSCLHSAPDTSSGSAHFYNRSLFVTLSGFLSEREMLLFDSTGTGELTESRDYTVWVEHKQTVGQNHCVRRLPPPCSHSLMAFFDSTLTNTKESRNTLDLMKRLKDWVKLTSAIPQSFQSLCNYNYVNQQLLEYLPMYCAFMLYLSENTQDSVIKNEHNWEKTDSTNSVVAHLFSMF